MDGRVYPTDNRPYQVDYASDTSGEFQRGGAQKYTPDTSGEFQRGGAPKYSSDSSGFSGEMRPPRPPQKHHHVVQIPKDQVFKTPPPENARLQKMYAARMKNRKSRNCFCFFRYLCMIILLLALVFVIAGGLFYLVYMPKIPKYTLTNLTVKNMDLSSANTFTFSPEFDATVTANNPNSKIGIYYKDGSDINVYYQGVKFANGKWPGFFQPQKNVTVLVVPIKGSGIRLSVPMRDQMVAEEKNGKVPLKLNMNVPVRIKAGKVTTWTIKVIVSCDVALSNLGTDSTIVSKSCGVKARAFGII